MNSAAHSHAIRFYLGVVSFLLVLTFVFFPVELRAQSTTTGAITGRVIDPSGAVIPNANVTLKNEATGVTASAVTDSNGNYHFALLDPGRYSVSAVASGFRTTTRPVTVTLGQTRTADFQLELGRPTEIVAVTAEAPLVQTNNANVTTTMNQLQIAQIPNPGNDLTFIAQMAPGTVMNTGAGYGNFSVYGLPATSNMFTVNGMSNMDPLFNTNNSGATNLLLGQNDVQEATVVVNGYSGEYGGLAGASVDYVTKTGTNRLHGNANYYWNGRALDANSFFNNSTDTPRPFINANQWSASLGGPIVKDKAFFFVDQEGIRLLIPTSVQALLPSPYFQNSTISNLTTQGLTNSVPFYQNIFNLYNHAPGSERATPFETCADVGVAELTPTETCVNQFRSTVGQPTDQWILTSRLDFNVSSKDRIFVHGEMNRGLQATVTDPISPLFNLISSQPEEQGQVGWTRLIGANKVNSFRATMQYYSATFNAPDLNKALQAFPSTMVFFDGSLTQLGGLDYIVPQGRNVTQYQFVDDLSWIKGNHSLKFGVNYYRSLISNFDFGILSSGELGLFSLDDFYNGGATGDFLYKVFPTSLVQPFALYRLGFYAQDEWRVAHDLKLTLSLRGDHASNPVCQHDCFARTVQPFTSMDHNVDIPYNQSIQVGQRQEFVSMTNVAWQPRVGFAWQPFGSRHNLVVRGGIGLFYDGVPGVTTESIAQNPPYSNTFIPAFDYISPDETTNLFSDAAQSNTAFLNGFANGGTLASIQAQVPIFTPPGLASAYKTVRLPQYQEWNLEIQKGFGQNTILSINYIGNHGIHEMIPNYSINGFADNFVGMPATAPDERYSTVDFLESAGVSSYNGMTITFRHNFSHGLIAANYTYGHALDIISNGGSTLPFIFATNESIRYPQNPYNIKDNYGNADYDNRHNLNLNYVYDLPIRWMLFGHGWKSLVDGWQVSGTLFTHSGLPYTVEDGLAESNLQGQNFNGPIYATYLNNPAPKVGCNTPDHPCLQASQFAPAADNPGMFGIQGRNRFFSPGYFNTDMGISKSTAIPGWESAKLSLGFQFFNLLNHPNFDQPVNNVADPQFGKILSTVSPPTSIFGNFLGADASPRLIQVRASISF